VHDVRDESITRVDAARILRQARRLRFLAHPRALADLAGAYHGARPGSGLTFAELRPYEPGDDVRHIDWNVTARQQRPYVRHFTEERALTLWLAADLSASMRFGLVGKTKADRACQAAALLASAAIQNGDRVGLLLVTDRIEEELLPRNGLRHLSRVLRSLVSGPTASRGSDLSVVPARFGRRARRSLIVAISDFRAPLVHVAWRRLAAKHQVIAVRVTDPLEDRLPDVGLLAAAEPETGQNVWIDTGSARAQALYQADAARRLREFERFCHETGIAAWSLSTAHDPLQRLQLLLRESPGPRRGRAGARR
jgi:uncharacterized protein (DUF58 family)